MKKILLINTLLITIFLSAIGQTTFTIDNADSPTTNSIDISGSVTPAPYLFSNQYYIVYDTNISFANEVKVAFDPSFSANEASTFTRTVGDLNHGKTYYFKVEATFVDASFDSYTIRTSSTASESTSNINQASTIVFSNLTSTSVTASWTDGGGDSRIVFVKEDGAVDYTPIDGTSYSVNQDFETSTEYGTGNYAVFNGASSSVNVTGLTSGKTYHFKIFEYTGTATSPVFRTDGHVDNNNPKAIQTLKGEPTTQAHTINFSSITNESMTVGWTRGDAVNNDKVIVLMSADAAVSQAPTDGETYAVDDLIGGSNTVVYNGVGTSVDLSSLSSGTNYYFRAYEYNNEDSNTDYFTDNATDNPNNATTLVGAPSQASDVEFYAISNNSVNVSWTNDDGENVIVVARAKDVDEVTPIDGTTYNASTDYSNPSSTNGTTGTGNIVVYQGSDETFTTTGLSAGSEYTFKVYAYNNSGEATTYSTIDGTQNPNTFITTASAPTTQTSSVIVSNIETTTATVNWTAGGGDSVIFISKTSLIDQHPVNGSIYQLGDFIDGGEVVFKGTVGDISTALTALTPGTEYYLRAYAYNNPESYPAYYTASATANPAIFTTDGEAPTLQANDIVITEVQKNQVTLSWTRGDGANCLVVARETGTTAVNPSDGVEYTAHPTYGTGEETGNGNYAVYRGTGTSVIITTLSAGTDYTFKVYELNNSGIESIYLTTDGVLNNPNSTTTLKEAPTTQASDIIFSNIETSTVTSSWTRGNGEGVILVASTNAIIGNPTDGTAYTPNTAFGSGNIIASGEYVLFAGTGTTADITALTVSTNYHYKLFEYNNSGDDITYQTSVDTTGNPETQSTLDSEPDQASFITHSSVTENSMTVSWVDLDGDGRIVVARQTNAVDATPINGVSYTANPTFEMGEEISSGQYVIYNGTGNSVDVTGLDGLTSYSFRVYSYNNLNGEIHYNINTAFDNPLSRTTLAAGTPTEQSSEITFSNIGYASLSINLTPGDGSRRIIAVKEATQGTITNPSNGTQYTASSDWSSKEDQLGSSGYYVVYDGTGSLVNLTNLSNETTYWVQAFEYNNTDANTSYLTTSATNNPNNTTTLLGAPITQAHTVSIGNIKSSAMDASWTNGDGEQRICIASTSNSFTDPTDNTTYTANGSYGSGDAIGSGYVVYNGIGSSITVTSLSENTPYYYKVYEYNNTGVYTLYYTGVGATNPGNATTLGNATWDGSSSQNWNTAANWDIEAVPGSSQSVIVPNVTNQPIISTNETHSVENITIEAGGSLTISNSATLNVTGNALLESPSGSGATGQLIITGSGDFSVSGTSTYQRYVSNDSVFISAPTSGASFSNFTGYTGDRFDETKETNGGWTALTSGSSLGQMEGWFIHRRNSGASRQFNISGNFNNGTQSTSLSKTNNDASLNGWHILGNPYPSAIDIQSASFNLSSGVDEVVYVYNNGGSYSTFVKGTGSSTGGGSRYIPAMQGFWLHANTNGASVSLTNDCRVDNTISFRKSTSVNDIPQIRLNISNSKDSHSDALIEFREGYSDDYDEGKEAFFLKGGTIGLYSQSMDANNLSINTLSMETFTNINEQALEIPIGIYTADADTIVISMENLENIPEVYNIQLYDAYFDEYFDLRKNDVTKFLSNSSQKQFSLNISKTAVSIQNDLLKQNITMYTNNNELIIKSELFLNNAGHIYIYDITGRLISSQQSEAQEIQRISLRTNGTFIVKIISDSFTISEKVTYNN